MLDIARDRVPTLETLFGLVDRLAGWKLNQVQLYTEHTFAYAGHEEVWAGASPYTAEELGAIDRHCRSVGIELVANQNTLGHFERWLRHERYRDAGHRPRRFRLGLRGPPLGHDPRPGQARRLRPRLRPARAARPRGRQPAGPHRAGRALGTGRRASSRNGSTGSGGWWRCR